MNLEEKKGNIEMVEPDYEMEQYWYVLKRNMENFYRDLSYSTKRPIEEWSRQMNEYQKNRDYIQIERSIYRIHVLYMLDLLKYHHLYHAHLFERNLQRWNKVCSQKEYQFLSPKSRAKSLHYEQKVHENIFILFQFFLRTSELKEETYQKYQKRIEQLFEQSEMYVFYDEWPSLVDLAIELKKSSLLELLRKLDGIDSYIQKKYKIEYPNEMKSEKLLGKIQSRQ